MAGSALFRTVADKDYLGFWASETLDARAVARFLDLDKHDVAKVAHVAPASVRFDGKIPKEVLDLGARVYTDRCAQCHGMNGGGDGSAVGQFPIAATDFRAQRPDIAASLRVLRNGMEGTPMAPWASELSEAELSAVAYYVRTFFTGGAK